MKKSQLKKSSKLKKDLGVKPLNKKRSQKKASGIVARINALALEIIEKNPEGIRWSELQRQIKAFDPTFHPKTVNGSVWQLVERFPDKVYKPEKGLFLHTKYKTQKKKAISK